MCWQTCLPEPVNAVPFCLNPSQQPASALMTPLRQVMTGDDCLCAKPSSLYCGLTPQLQPHLACFSLLLHPTWPLTLQGQALLLGSFSALPASCHCHKEVLEHTPTQPLSDPDAQELPAVRRAVVASTKDHMHLSTLPGVFLRQQKVDGIKGFCFMISCVGSPQSQHRRKKETRGINYPIYPPLMHGPTQSKSCSSNLRQVWTSRLFRCGEEPGADRGHEQSPAQLAFNWPILCSVELREEQCGYWSYSGWVLWHVSLLVPGQSRISRYKL